MCDSPTAESLKIALSVDLGGCGCDPEIEDICDVHRDIALAVDAVLERGRAERKVIEAARPCALWWDTEMTEESAIAFALAFDKLKAALAALTPTREGGSDG